MQSRNRNTHRDDSEDDTADLELEETKSLYFCTGLYTELNQPENSCKSVF